MLTTTQNYQLYQVLFVIMLITIYVNNIPDIEASIFFSLFIWENENVKYGFFVLFSFIFYSSLFEETIPDKLHTAVQNQAKLGSY